jgi:hypothetical protein
MAPRSSPVIALMLSLTAMLSRPSSAGSDLHLTKHFTILVAKGQVLLEERRELYVRGDRLAMQTPKQWLLLLVDRQTAWMLDGERRAVSQISLANLRRSTRVASAPGTTPPRFLPSAATRTVAGLQCRVYRANTPTLTVESCITRQLPALERFQPVLGQAPDVPGVPLDLTMTVTVPQGQRMTIRQRVERVSTEPLDAAIFAEPTQAPSIPPRERRK